MHFASSEHELGEAGVIRALGSISSSYSRAVEVHLAVDEIVIRRGCCVTAFVERGDYRFGNVEVLSVILTWRYKQETCM